MKCQHIEFPIEFSYWGCACIEFYKYQRGSFRSKALVNWSYQTFASSTKIFWDRTFPITLVPLLENLIKTKLFDIKSTNQISQTKVRLIISSKIESVTNEQCRSLTQDAKDGNGRQNHAHRVVSELFQALICQKRRVVHGEVVATDVGHDVWNQSRSNLHQSVS